MNTCTQCDQPRWRGPKGTNNKLTMCEKHQKDYWRTHKTPKERQRQNAPKTQKKATSRGHTPARSQRQQKARPAVKSKSQKMLVVNPLNGCVQIIKATVIRQYDFSDVRHTELATLYRGMGYDTIYAVDPFTPEDIHTAEDLKVAIAAAVRKPC